MSAIKVAQQLLAGHSVRKAKEQLTILQIINWSTIKAWLPKDRKDDQLIIILLSFPYNWNTNTFYVSQFLNHYGIYLGVADQDKLEILITRLEWYRDVILSQDLGITSNLKKKQMSDRDWFLHTSRIYKRTSKKRKYWNYFYRGKVVIVEKLKGDERMVVRENMLYFLSLVSSYTTNKLI